MTDSGQLIEAMDRRVLRREGRREFFQAALGMGALAVGGAAALSFSTQAGAQAAVTDNDILNFALNLEYLEAQFYSYAYNGAGLPANLLTGTGTQGAVITGTGPNMARAVPFTDPVVRQYAREIAEDERNHVAFLRTALTSGSTSVAVAQPQINISGAADGPFAAAARAAGIITSNTDTFDPYADDNSFLLGAFIFEDVGVTAYKGASPLLTSNTFLDAAAGILAAEAFHAGLIRSALYARGVDLLRTRTEQISTARDSLDGSSDLDQGIAPITTSSVVAANVAPTNSDGITFSRSAAQTLNIVYLNAAAVSMGGFFPAGVNGTIRSSVVTA